MSKKVIIAICMVVAFFLGAIWVDYVPVVAPLVAFLELGVGFAGGFLICKEIANQEFSNYKAEINSVRQAHKAVAEELASVKEATKKVKKSKKTSTNKE